jgi:hypothetical protein
LLACAFALAAFGPACSVGHGDGAITGTISIEGCRAQAAYDLAPTAFFAQAVEQLLRIRVQRGSDLEVKSDGIAVLVEDAALVKREFLGEAIDVSSTSGPRIDVSVFLNETCPPGRDKTPVALKAVSGTIRFEQLYAPKADKDEVEIDAYLEDMRFEDPRNAARWAELSGNFNFLYVRGSPAQRFP